MMTARDWLAAVDKVRECNRGLVRPEEAAALIAIARRALDALESIDLSADPHVAGPCLADINALAARGETGGV